MNGNGSEKRKTGNIAVGQGALIAVAVITLVAMATMALALNQAAFYNSKRIISNRQSMQLYYVAQAGIQEALATRFVPRTNYLNFLQYAGAAGGPHNTPLYGLSGRVFRDASSTNNNELIGYYRYFIVGGDPIRRLNGTEDNSRLTLNLGVLQHYYILSKGSVCLSDNGKVGVGLLQIAMAGDNPTPSCNQDPGDPGATYALENLTVLAEADLSRTLNTKDLISDYKLFKNDTNITLGPAATDTVFVPGRGINNQVNFEETWSATIASEPANELEVFPAWMIFYTMAQGLPDADKSMPFTGTDTNVAAPIDARSVMKVFFNGGVDYRTLYIRPDTANNETIAADCTADPSNCVVNVYDDTAGVYFTNSTLYPSFPSETQFILLPPLSAGTVMGSGVDYEVTLGKELSDWRGNSLDDLGGDYEVEFTTAP